MQIHRHTHTHIHCACSSQYDVNCGMRSYCNEHTLAAHTKLSQGGSLHCDRLMVSPCGCVSYNFCGVCVCVCLCVYACAIYAYHLCPSNRAFFCVCVMNGQTLAVLWPSNSYTLFVSVHSLVAKWTQIYLHCTKPLCNDGASLCLHIIATAGCTYY